MANNLTFCGSGNGILEQLENHIRLKIDYIKGLLDLRSKQSNEKYTEVFEDVSKTLSEVDELVDTLTTNIEREKSFVKYINSILKSNESQMLNLKKLSEIISKKEEVTTDFGVPTETQSSNSRSVETKKSYNLKSFNSNKIPLSRLVKTTKSTTFKTTHSATLKPRNGIPPKSSISNGSLKKT